MPPKRFKVQHLAIDDEGVQIGYYDPDVDMKAPGLVRLHTLIVPNGGDYDDEIADVMDALLYLLNDVNEDWNNLSAPRAAPVAEDDQDEDE